MRFFLFLAVFLVPKVGSQCTKTDKGTEYWVECTESGTIEWGSGVADKALVFSGPSGVTVDVTGTITAKGSIAVKNLRVRVESLTINDPIASNCVSYEGYDSQFYVQQSISLSAGSQSGEIEVPKLSHAVGTPMTLQDGKWIYKAAYLTVPALTLTGSTLSFGPAVRELSFASVEAARQVITIDRGLTINVGGEFNCDLTINKGAAGTVLNLGNGTIGVFVVNDQTQIRGTLTATTGTVNANIVMNRGTLTFDSCTVDNNVEFTGTGDVIFTKAREGGGEVVFKGECISVTAPSGSYTCDKATVKGSGIDVSKVTFKNCSMSISGAVTATQAINVYSLEVFETETAVNIEVTGLRVLKLLKKASTGKLLEVKDHEFTGAKRFLEILNRTNSFLPCETRRPLPHGLIQRVVQPKINTSLPPVSRPMGRTKKANVASVSTPPTSLAESVSITLKKGDSSSLLITGESPTQVCTVTLDADAQYDQIQVGASFDTLNLVVNQKDKEVVVDIVSTSFTGITAGGTSWRMTYPEGMGDKVKIDGAESVTLFDVSEMPTISSATTVAILSSSVTITEFTPTYQASDCDLILQASGNVEFKTKQLQCNKMTVEIGSAGLTFNAKGAQTQLIVNEMVNLQGALTVKGGGVTISSLTLEANTKQAQFVVEGTLGGLSIQSITAVDEINATCKDGGFFDVYCNDLQPTINLVGSGQTNVFQVQISTFTSENIELKIGENDALILTGIETFKWSTDDPIKVLQFSLYESNVKLDGEIEAAICDFHDSTVTVTSQMDTPNVYLSGATLTGDGKPRTVESMYFDGVVNLIRFPVTITMTVYTFSPSGGSDNSVFLEDCMIYLGNESQPLEYSSDEGIPTSFSFYGEVVFMANTTHWLNKNSYFFSDVTFQDNVVLSNAVGPIVQTETAISCENGKLRYYYGSFKCCHNCEAMTSVDKEVVTCDDDSSPTITGESISCAKGKLTIGEGVTIVDYSVPHSILVSLSDFQGSTYSFEEVKLNIVNPAENALSVTAVKSELSYLAAGTTFQSISLDDNSKCTCYASAISGAIINLESSKLRFIYEKREPVAVSELNANNSIIDTDFEGAKNTKDTVLSIATAQLCNVTLGNITATISSLSVENSLTIAQSYIQLPKGNPAVFTDAVLRSTSGNVTSANQLQFIGSLDTTATLIAINDTSEVILDFDEPTEYYLGCFSLNCRVTFSGTGDGGRTFAFGDGSFVLGANLEFRHKTATSQPQNVISIKKGGNASLSSANKIGNVNKFLLEGGALAFENVPTVNYELEGTGSIRLTSGAFAKPVKLTNSEINCSGELSFADETVELGGTISIRPSGVVTLKFSKVSFVDCAVQADASVTLDISTECTFTSQSASTTLLADEDNDVLAWRNIVFNSNSKTILNSNRDISMSSCQMNIQGTLELISGRVTSLSTLNLQKVTVKSTNGSLGGSTCIFASNTFERSAHRFECQSLQYDKLNRMAENAQLQFVGTETSKDSIFTMDHDTSTVRFIQNKDKLDLQAVVNFQPQTDYEVFQWSSKPESLPRVNSQYQLDFTDRHLVIRALKCKSGYAPDSTGTCQLCPLGQYSNSDKCTPCPIGTYANIPGLGMCLPCPYNTYTDSTGSEVCTPCPANMVTLSTGSTGKDQCWCASGYRPIDGVCSECTAGYDCSEPSSTYSEPSIRKGYYADETGVYKCNVEAACLGYRCADGYESFKCAKCAEGYHLISWGVCEKCTKGSIALVVVGLIPLVIYILVLCVFPDKCRTLVPFLFIFQQYTQVVVAIGRFNVNYRTTDGLCFQIFEAFNLDFHKVIQCYDGNGIWAQGILYCVLDIVFLVVFLGFRIHYRKRGGAAGAELDSHDELDELAQYLDGKDYKRIGGPQFSQEKIDHIWSVYIFVLVVMSGAQMAWFFSVASLNGSAEILRYEYLELFKGEWLRYSAVVFIVFLFVFVPIVALLIAMPRLWKRKTTFEFYRVFGYVAIHVEMGRLSLLSVVDVILLLVIHTLNSALTMEPLIVVTVTLVLLLLRLGLALYYHWYVTTQHTYCFASVTLGTAFFLLGGICDLDNDPRSVAFAVALIMIGTVASFVLALLAFVWEVWRLRQESEGGREISDKIRERGKTGFDALCILYNPLIRFSDEKVRSVGVVIRSGQVPRHCAPAPEKLENLIKVFGLEGEVGRERPALHELLEEVAKFINGAPKELIREFNSAARRAPGQDGTVNGVVPGDTGNGVVQDDTVNGVVPGDTVNGVVQDGTVNGVVPGDTVNGVVQDDTGNGVVQDDTGNGVVQDDTDNGVGQDDSYSYTYSDTSSGEE